MDDSFPIKQALLIDLGNTHCDWGVAVEGRIIRRGKLPAAEFHRLSDAAELPCGIPFRTFIASVAGNELTSRLAVHLRRTWGKDPVLLSAEPEAFGVRNGYTQPTRLGVDRWLALVGAYALSPEPACIVDCGSAITIDLLAEHGKHLGGVILPGIAMMERALMSETHIAPHDASLAPTFAAQDTGTAIYSGAILAASGLAEHAYDSLAAKAGVQPRLIVTGGAAPLLLGTLHPAWIHEPDLVLLGMLRYASVVMNDTRRAP